MKKSMNLWLILVGITGIYAQEPPLKDKMETSVVTKVIVNDGKSVEATTVKEETTTEEQQIDLTDKENDPINQNIKYTTSEVKKTVKVNNNYPYASLLKNKYYSSKNKKYLFTPDKNGFYISLYDNNRQKRVAKLIKTSAKNYYIMHGDQYHGIGYFDANENFIVEYYDKSGDRTILERYQPNK